MRRICVKLLHDHDHLQPITHRLESFSSRQSNSDTLRVSLDIVSKSEVIIEVKVADNS